jgi:acetolactate synthase I/II/III large subunit
MMKMTGAQALLASLKHEGVEVIFGYPGAQIMPILDQLYVMEKNNMKMPGAKALLESLKKEEVEVIFGYPGGQTLPIHDAIYTTEGLRHILVRHEQGAAHAADGYARASGKVGVCLATSGPGATNLVTGIANAYMDSIPMVAITGQVPTFAIGKDSFQEVDITGITMPITKHNFLVTHAREIPEVVKEAFYIASTGRKGPVLIDVPRDAQVEEIEFSYPEKVELRSYRPFAGEAHSKMIERAAELIAQAEKPVIYGGGGIIACEASKELFDFAVKIGAPVTMTLMGKGGFPDDHPLALGMPGMHGTAYANYALHEADVIISVGTRFDDRVTGKISTFARKAKIIHIDIDPAEIGKSVAVEVPVVGNAKQVLAALTRSCKKKQHTEWLEKIAAWKKKHPLSYKGEGLKPQFIIQQIWEATKGEAIICTEVGQNQMWAAQWYPCHQPRHFISSGGLGTMGFGFPAAVGAQVACPDKVVWDIAGDGSIQMNIQEMATAVVNKLPIKIAVLNNRYLGMVRQWQQLFFGRRYSQTDLNVPTPDFVKLVEAYGGVGLLVTKQEEVKPAIKRAMEIKDRPCLIDFRIAREENVMPMVPAGGSIDDMLVD